MDLKDFLADIKDQPSYIIERNLNSLVRQNYHFQSLSSDNREIVLSLVKKYKEKLRTGVGVSQYVINRDMYNLYQKRLELKLTEVDRDHIRDILESFKQ
jgi:hypothetical protein